MFDVWAVRDIAEQFEFDELVEFLSDRKNHKAYAHFIVTGE